MSLFEYLDRILPEVLPKSASKAITGTRLIARLRSKIEEDYADSTYRHHLSVMSKDASKPIAKVEGRHGYYNRNLSALENPEPTSRLDETREEKFRALYVRWAEAEGRFPMVIRHHNSSRRPRGVNVWKFPDVVVLDWNRMESRSDPSELDRHIFATKQSLGERLFCLKSVELKVTPSIQKVREFFFQCVSNSKWAHLAELAFAGKVEDTIVGDELRRLSAFHGVSVVTFGLTDDQLDKLPDAGQIRAGADSEINTVVDNLQPTPVAPIVDMPRAELDWQYLLDMLNQSHDFRMLLEWIWYCIEKRQPFSFPEFNKSRSRSKVSGRRRRPRTQ